MDKLLDPAFIECRVLPVVIAFALGVLITVQQHDDAVDRQRARAEAAWRAASDYAMLCGAPAAAIATAAQEDITK